MLTNRGLVEHCKKALSEGWGYVYGTFGQVLTQSIFVQKLKQYPSEISKYADFIRIHWMGKRTADCVGLIKSYLWWNGNDVVYDARTDVSANGMYEKAKEKGKIDTLPEISGLCLWFDGHIGVYIGQGWVIESRGTKYGVVKTKLEERPWTHWLKCPYIEYVKDKKITVEINGKPLAMDVDPINVNGRVLVPVRAIAEALECKVDWDGDTQTVKITR